MLVIRPRSAAVIIMSFIPTMPGRQRVLFRGRRWLRRCRLRCRMRVWIRNRIRRLRLRQRQRRVKQPVVPHLTILKVRTQLCDLRRNGQLRQIRPLVDDVALRTSPRSAGTLVHTNPCGPRDWSLEVAVVDRIARDLVRLHESLKMILEIAKTEHRGRGHGQDGICDSSECMRATIGGPY